jgi:hypothetical protein
MEERRRLIDDDITANTDTTREDIINIIDDLIIRRDEWSWIPLRLMMPLI